MDNPLEIRVGSTGAGLFVGCGAGIGFLTPISLHSIPVVGQLAGSLATSLSQVDASMGGIGWKISSALNSRAKPLGLSAGWGCGVALGYGWGAGIMLKPNALESLTAAIKSKVPKGLLEKITPLQQSGSSQGQGSLQGGVSLLGLHSSDAIGAGTAAVIPPATMAASPVDTPATTALSPSTVSNTAALEKDVAELTKIVLQQQITLERVQRQLESLQHKLLPRPNQPIKQK